MQTLWRIAMFVQSKYTKLRRLTHKLQILRSLVRVRVSVWMLRHVHIGLATYNSRILHMCTYIYDICTCVQSIG